MAAAVAVVAYAGLCHYSNSVTDAPNLGAWLALAPLLSIGLLLLWRSTHPSIAALAAVLAAILVFHYWASFAKGYSQLYVLQDCGMYGLLAATFGRSLLVDRIPLCTQLAAKVHGPLTAAEVRYTRRVTLAWFWFFIAITAALAGLFVAAPLRVWSLFANFGVMPLVGLMFAVEYAVRRRVLPQAARGGILATVRVYLASSP